MVRFNSPPGWPPAADGWVPTPSTPPDPTWPAPPPGWAFYVDEHGAPVTPPPGAWQPPTPVGAPAAPAGPARKHTGCIVAGCLGALVLGVVVLVATGMALGVIPGPRVLFGAPRTGSPTPAPATGAVPPASSSSPSSIDLAAADIGAVFPVVAAGRTLALTEKGAPSTFPKETNACVEEFLDQVRPATSYADGGDPDSVGMTVYTYAGADAAATAKGGIEQSYRTCARTMKPVPLGTGTAGSGRWSAWKGLSADGTTFTSILFAEGNVLVYAWGPDGTDTQTFMDSVSARLHAAG